MDATSSFLGLPSEILHNVFSSCLPADLGALARGCATLRSYVAGNQALCKDVYLTFLDKPPAIQLQHNFDWEQELHAAVNLQKLLDSTDASVKLANLGHISGAIQRLIETSGNPGQDGNVHHSRNTTVLVKAFRSRVNVDEILCRSGLFRRTGLVDPTNDDPNLHQLSAKLHVLCGMTDALQQQERGRVALHTYARAVVYDLRNYTDATFWGPFQNDHSANADWEKLECIMIVLSYNLRRFHGKTEGRFPLLWHNPWTGVRQHSFQSPPFKPARHQNELELQDPYNITGTWMRVVCFLDYSDLYTYNFSSTIPENRPRRPLETEEAIRMITMKVRVTKIMPPGEGQGQSLPVVHFAGNSRSMHAGWDPNANSSIRGTVSLTPEGEVRWTTFSVFHGEERWRSEGIQVGGVQSARGVWGHWFDKDFDPEGPAGPTAFWKITDDFPEPQPGRKTYTAANHMPSADAEPHGTGDLVAYPHAPNGAHVNVPLHPYMQTVGDDDADYDDVTEGGMTLVLGAAGVRSNGLDDDLADDPSRRLMTI